MRRGSVQNNTEQEAQFVPDAGKTYVGVLTDSDRIGYTAQWLHLQVTPISLRGKNRIGPDYRLIQQVTTTDKQRFLKPGTVFEFQFQARPVTIDTVSEQHKTCQLTPMEWVPLVGFHTPFPQTENQDDTEADQTENTGSPRTATTPKGRRLYHVSAISDAICEHPARFLNRITPLPPTFFRFPNDPHTHENPKLRVSFHFQLFNPRKRMKIPADARCTLLLPFHCMLLLAWGLRHRTAVSVLHVMRLWTRDDTRDEGSHAR